MEESFGICVFEFLVFGSVVSCVLQSRMEEGRTKRGGSGSSFLKVACEKPELGRERDWGGVRVVEGQ